MVNSKRDTTRSSPTFLVCNRVRTKARRAWPYSAGGAHVAYIRALYAGLAAVAASLLPVAARAAPGDAWHGRLRHRLHL